jgi:hypothetical protein
MHVAQLHGRSQCHNCSQSSNSKRHALPLQASVCRCRQEGLLLRLLLLLLLLRCSCSLLSLGPSPRGGCHCTTLT